MIMNIYIYINMFEIIIAYVQQIFFFFQEQIFMCIHIFTR